VAENDALLASVMRKVLDDAHATNGGWMLWTSPGRAPQITFDHRRVPVTDEELAAIKAVCEELCHAYREIKEDPR
jgi:hypothetical protein